MNIILRSLLPILGAIFATPPILLVLGTTTKNHPLIFYARALLSFIALILCAAYGTLASLCLNVFGYGGLGQWTTARAFKWMMYVFTGVWFEIDDPHKVLGNVRPVVFLGNHQTELDVAFLGHLFPRYTSVTAKKSLARVPILGQFSMFI